MWLINASPRVRDAFPSIWPFAVLVLGSLTLWLRGQSLAQNQLPYTAGGPDSVFSQIDFAQMSLAREEWLRVVTGPKGALGKQMPSSDVVSLLDMEAPDKAVQHFDHAITLLKEQKSKEAIPLLEQAVKIYPRFVAAHNALGLAYVDQQDPRAQTEFETAAQLDENFPGPFVNLGMLALRANDFATADANLEKASFLAPKNPATLFALAFAQNGNHKYSDALQTASKVHALNHQGMAPVHYIAASAALSLHDVETMKRELNTFLQEDPTNPLAPIARNNLEPLTNPAAHLAEAATAASSSIQPVSHVDTFPNTERLQNELDAIDHDPDDAPCETCDGMLTAALPMPLNGTASPNITARSRPLHSDLFTIHKHVAETDLSFSVSHKDGLVDNLSESDIKVLDGNKPPLKILQFAPQAQLPLRLGLLIDVSGSVADRFSFEKHAAERFLQKLLSPASDLAFVAGFSTDTFVAQDFSGDPQVLTQGIERLSDSNGGTSLFDAIYYACWKLAAYPEQDRAAKVLLVLTDGQDNSSHRSLRQSIEEAQVGGVTIYAVSTGDSYLLSTDADKVLQTLAERSGGQSIFPRNMHNLDHYLDKLRDVIRSRYMIAYRPADFIPNGQYRPVRISAAKNGKRLQVHTNGGYYARADASQQ